MMMGSMKYGSWDLHHYWSNKEKYREKWISRIQDSNWMDEYEPTKKDIKEGFPADDSIMADIYEKAQGMALHKKSDAQLKKILRQNGLSLWIREKD